MAKKLTMRLDQEDPNRPQSLSIQGSLLELSRIVAAKTLKYPYC